MPTSSIDRPNRNYSATPENGKRGGVSVAGVRANLKAKVQSGKKIDCDARQMERRVAGAEERRTGGKQGSISDGDKTAAGKGERVIVTGDEGAVNGHLIRQ